MQNHVMRLTQAARGRVRHGGTGASHHIVTVSRGVEAPVQSRKMVLVREDLIIDSLRAPPAQTHRLLVQNQLTALMPAVDMMAMPPKLRSGVACCWTSLLELLRLLPRQRTVQTGTSNCSQVEQSNHRRPLDEASSHPAH